jgi:DNA-binding SARP family transcriptional activator/tetratricopeptide (TPR) repeat protein
LLNLLWAGQRPSRAALHSRVSELRRTIQQLGAKDVALEGRADGYELLAPAHAVDAYCFTDLVARSRDEPAEVARATLRQAVALWRGPVLGGQLATGSVESPYRHLELAHLAALEDLYEVELKLGRHREIADEVRSLVREHPERERIVGQALLALHRSGRTTEALQEYDRWRGLLADEFGMDPSADLERLHVAVLRRDPALDLSIEPISIGATRRDDQHRADASAFVGARPHTLPPDIPDFSGREAEADQIRRTLRDSSTDRTRVVTITGRGGVGKTALAIRLAHQLRDQFPDGQLYVNLRGADEREALAPSAVLDRFLRACGVSDAAIPQELDERLDLYRDLLSTRRVIVLLDNAASDEQVLPLLPSGPSCAAIVTSRLRLGSEIGGLDVPLEVMTPADAVALLARVTGPARIDAERSSAHELCRLCGHLPLALRVAAAKLSAKPHWSVEKLVALLRDERKRLDHLRHGRLDVRSSVTLSFQDLDDDVRSLLVRMADAALPEISVWACAALADTTLDRAEDMLECLFDAQLIDVANSEATGHVRYRMHDLVRLFANEQASGIETVQDLRESRRRLYDAWVTMTRAAIRTVFGTGYKFIGAEPTRWNVDTATVEALVADTLRWFESEQGALTATVRRAVQDGASRNCWQLTYTASPLFEMRRSFDEWEEMLDAAADAVRAGEDPHGQGAILIRRGQLHCDRVQLDDALATFSRAQALFEQAGDRHGHAVATMWMGTVRRFVGDRGSALTDYLMVVPVLTDTGDFGLAAESLRGIAQIWMDGGDLDEAEVHFHRALDLCRAHGVRRGQAQVLFWYGMLLLERQDYGAAEARFRAALEVTRSLRDRPGEAQCLRGLGTCFQHQGDIQRARSTLLNALHLVQQPRMTLLERHVRRSLAELDPATSATEPGA